MCSLVNSLLGRFENRIHGQRTCETQIEPPLFIEGMVVLIQNLTAEQVREPWFSSCTPGNCALLEGDENAGFNLGDYAQTDRPPLSR